ncbi:MAG: hypothetical protein ACODAQ_13005, partial [Phycisphaeraceae bacterium]
LLSFAAADRAAAQSDVPPNVEAIRAEALRPNDSDVGRPLPLAAHWQNGDRDQDDDYRTLYQMSLIEDGHHVLPALSFPSPTASPGDDAEDARYSAPVLRQLREWDLPFSLNGTQWESWMYAKKDGPFAQFHEVEPEDSPMVLNTEGEIENRLSPFGPVKHWREVGRIWTDSEWMALLQSWYPDPPRVIMLSNNESGKLRWHEAEQSARYLEQHGEGRDDTFKRRVVGDGWIERYPALHEGMREGLRESSWRENATFVGYGVIGLEFMGRWGGWGKYSMHVPGRISPWPMAWDGGSPSYYTHNWNPSTDHKVWSPQIQSMNWLFMLEQVYEQRPDFWFEISVWDGSPSPHHPKYDEQKDQVQAYLDAGQTYPPQRYGGYVQFGMWLLQPRVVREFRGHMHRRDDHEAHTLALVEAVDRVHENEVLRRFWRDSTLVADRAQAHPYQANVPEEYAEVDRWFLLEADANPDRPWELGTELSVFALARVREAEGGGREWLIYAHAPIEAQSDVRVRLPEYGPVTIDVARGGSFYHVRENAGEATLVLADAVNEE